MYQAHMIYIYNIICMYVLATETYLHGSGSLLFLHGLC